MNDRTQRILGNQTGVATAAHQAAATGKMQDQQACMHPTHADQSPQSAPPRNQPAPVKPACQLPSRLLREPQVQCSRRAEADHDQNHRGSRREQHPGTADQQQQPSCTQRVKQPGSLKLRVENQR